MKTIETWKVFLFFGVLSAMAFAINNLPRLRLFSGTVIETPNTPVEEKSAPRVEPTVPVEAPKPVPKPTPVEVRPRLWPSDITPTKRIPIPNPQGAVSGLMETSIKTGDDLEVALEPWWMLSDVSLDERLSPNIQIMFDEGDGFKTLEQLNASRLEQGEVLNSFLRKKRVIRMRLKPGIAEETPLRMMVSKEKPIKPQPPVSIPPQRIGNLEISFRRLQSIGSDQKIAIDLDFQNTSGDGAIGVALHGKAKDSSDPHRDEIDIDGSLMSSTGLQSFCEELTGLKVMNANPVNLTELEPNETRHVSFQYIRRAGNNSEPVTSYRLTIQVVYSGNFKSETYASHRAVPNTLPPGCKMQTAVFDIPVRNSRQ